MKTYKKRDMETSVTFKAIYTEISVTTSGKEKLLHGRNIRKHDKRKHKT
jgi:hypothetical protein